MDSKSFFSHWIVRNLIFAVVFVLSLVIVVDIALKIYTHHGREVVVPDMYNLSVSDAEFVATAAGLRAYVRDSVYVLRMTKGTVFSQNPRAGTKVKDGRRVALTINAVNSRKVSMPLLVGYSMRQAKAELLSKGLTVGKLVYVRDMATNNVLEQRYQGKEIEPGTQIETGSVIDLVVGLNDVDGRTIVPDLIGMKYLRALEAITDNSLNAGKLRFDSTVHDYNDTLNAFVFSQSPSGMETAVKMGEQVSLQLTLDESKLPESKK